MLGSSKYIWPGGIPQDLSTENEPLTYIDSTHLTAVEVLDFIAAFIEQYGKRERFMTTQKLKEIRWKNKYLSVETSISIIFHTRNWCWRKPSAIFKACLLFGALQGVPRDASVARHCPCDHNNDCAGRVATMCAGFGILSFELSSSLDLSQILTNLKEFDQLPTSQTGNNTNTTQTWLISLTKSHNFEEKKFDHHYDAPSDKEWLEWFWLWWTDHHNTIKENKFHTAKTKLLQKYGHTPLHRVCRIYFFLWLLVETRELPSHYLNMIWLRLTNTDFQYQTTRSKLD